jgi:cytochrome c peroxidase
VVFGALLVLAACGSPGPEREHVAMLFPLDAGRVVLREDTPERRRFGELLFTRRLGATACVECHVEASSHQDGRVHGRNTPSLVDVTRQAVFGWDGATNDLTTMVRMELARRHGLADGAALQRAVAADAELAAAAAQAFPSGVDLVGASEALVLHLDAGRSTTNWDRYVDGDDEALSSAARAGLATFLEVGCATCHRGRSLGGGSLHRLGLAVPYPSADPGRMGITGRPEDAQVFRAPMLRSAARTPPYLHDGSIATLREAIVVMARHELGKELAPAQLDGLLAFLEELRPVGGAGL